MKRFALFCALVMMISLCACSVRDPAGAAPAAVGEERTATVKKAGKKKADKAEKQEIVPASGPDLLIPEPLSDEAKASLETLRGEIRSSGNLCGMAFLGYVSPQMPMEESILTYGLFEEIEWADRFPFLYEMTPEQCVNPAFSDFYCLVPDKRVVKVRITQMEMDEFYEPTDTVAAVLAERDGAEPLFFSAESNGWGGSNIRITLTDEQGRELSFCPAILANLGEIAPCEGVMDFTPRTESPMDSQ